VSAASELVDRTGWLAFDGRSNVACLLPLPLVILDTMVVVDFISTIIVSSSTDVASVDVAPSDGDDRELVELDRPEELGGNGLNLASSPKLVGTSILTSCVLIVISSSSTLIGLSALSFLTGWDSGEVNSSKSLFLLVGVWQGSTDGDLSRGDSTFLNLEIDLGVLFGTCGLRFTSGVSDWFRDELTEAFLRRRSAYAKLEG
jgi:hypothetical protein